MLKNKIVSIFSSVLLLSGGLLYGQETFNVLSLENGAYIVEAPRSHAAAHETSNTIKEWTKEAIIDGTTHKGWSTDKNVPFPLVFIFELSEECLIEKFGFNTECEKYDGISAKQLQVEVSTIGKDGGYMTVLEPKLKQNAKTTYYEISPTKARWVKVTIHSNHGFSTHTELMEVEAHGSYTQQKVKPIDLTGDWQSTWGTVSLRHEGSTVNGCYEYRDGLITNAGFERRIFTYKWLEEGEYGMGHAVLVVNEEGDRLNGIWGFGNDLKEYGIWTFKRIGDQPTRCYQTTEKNEKEEDVKINRLKESIESSGKLIVYGINFETNSSVIREESYKTLGEIFLLLKKNDTMKLRIDGHTDDVGTKESNKVLSQSRAESVKSYLVKMGILDDRLVSNGFGEELPIADNSTQLGRAANRRVELVLLTD